jgi:Fe-S oxidoreductase
LPPKVKGFLENIRRHGNPWGEARSRRAEWAKSMEGVKKFGKGDEYLLYVGCIESFDPVGRRIPSALAELLIRAKVSFGVLGEEELCDGNDVRLLGGRGPL